MHICMYIYSQRYHEKCWLSTYFHPLPFCFPSCFWWGRLLTGVPPPRLFDCALYTCLMLRNIWGGVGWGVRTSVALVHMFDATQHMGWGGVGCKNIRCTCTHVWCYATYGVATPLLSQMERMHTNLRPPKPWSQRLWNGIKWNIQSLSSQSQSGRDQAWRKLARNRLTESGFMWNELCQRVWTTEGQMGFWMKTASWITYMPGCSAADVRKTSSKAWENYVQRYEKRTFRCSAVFRK